MEAVLLPDGAAIGWGKLSIGCDADVLYGHLERAAGPPTRTDSAEGAKTV